MVNIVGEAGVGRLNVDKQATPVLYRAYVAVEEKRAAGEFGIPEDLDSAVCQDAAEVTELAEGEGGFGLEFALEKVLKDMKGRYPDAELDKMREYLVLYFVEAADMEESLGKEEVARNAHDDMKAAEAGDPTVVDAVEEGTREGLHGVVVEEDK